MKVPVPMDDLGTGSQPLAFLLHSGAYSSFVLAAVPRDEGDLLALMTEGDLWGNDCVLLSDSAVFFSVGSDAVNQAIWVYLDTHGISDPPERSLSATFVSQGERIYLESLIDMTFGEYCDQFFLPAGEYEVRFLSWNLEHARDNFDADPKLFRENVHHELHFTSTANDPAMLARGGTEEMERHALG